MRPKHAEIPFCCSVFFIGFYECPFLNISFKLFQLFIEMFYFMNLSSVRLDMPVSMPVLLKR